MFQNYNNSRKGKLLFLFLTFIAGIIILLPHTDFQAGLSQGDHGLNLYNAEAVLRGETPYKDFHWFYGPLMLYYYAVVFKLLGASIHSALIGQTFLNLLSGIFIFLSLSLFLSPFLSIIGSMWYWVFWQESFYTYNHSGGTFLCIVLTYFVFLYIKNRQIRYLYLTLPLTILLAMIKLNIGAAMLAGITITSFISDLLFKKSIASKKYFYLSAIIITPMIIILIHWIMLKDLPFYYIYQCFLFFGTDAFIPPGLIYTTTQLAKKIIFNLTLSWTDMFLGMLLLGCSGNLIYNIFSKKSNIETRNQAILLLVSLLFFYVLLAHEYLLSGARFRILWAQPFSILLIFIILGFTAKRMSHIIKLLLSFTIFSVILLTFTYKQIYFTKMKTPSKYLSHSRAQTYITNPSSWINTVTNTLAYIEENMEESERFLALPYEPLYYFLSGKPSPTRQLAFFEFTKIPEKQEREIIQEIEKNNVNWVVLSNRVVSNEQGLGLFGKTHCSIINNYLYENFRLEATFGDWEHMPVWAYFHGTKILKRMQREKKEQ